MANVFAVQIFFIVFRECLESIIVLSVLFSFLKQCLGQPGQDPAIYRSLRRQVWWGTFTGLGICLIIGGAFIGVFYGLGKDIWAQSEDLWEGIFYLIATVIITIMGIALLRINKMQDKWRVKIAQALADHNKRAADKATTNIGSGPGTWARRLRFRGSLSGWSRRHAMFILPFITILREGIEAVVFVGGVSLGLPATAFPLPVVCGLLAALAMGYLLYRGGNAMSIQIFMIISTSVLYLIAAGMFSRSVWFLQYRTFAQAVGSDAAEVGSGPGSYDINQSVWHVNCCNPYTDNGWDVFNVILGWQNSATYGSVISYNIYWLAIIITLGCLMYEERYGELLPRRQLLSAMARVPGLKAYATKKLAQKDFDAHATIDEIRTEHFVNMGAIELSR